jgi:N-acetyl-gamma-glutamyl-phosphate reductase
MVKVGIVGVSGYSGMTALELLLGHPKVRITYASANNTQGAVSDIWPRFFKRTELNCQKYQTKKAIGLCDLVFLAVPHTVAMELAPELLAAKKRVIDFSGDYRLADAENYQRWYKVKHASPPLLKKAVYGLPEFFRARLPSATLVANPGCYATATLLALVPLLKHNLIKPETVVVDAKSGVSGAGKSSNPMHAFNEANENFQAYSVIRHRHQPEIEQIAGDVSGRPIQITFVPHLVPMHRGLLAVVYAQLRRPLSMEKVRHFFQKDFGSEAFIRLLPPGRWPQTKDVSYSNFCDINIDVDTRTNRVIVLAALDNLVKGAAGQAIQNMNLMAGFKETEGLNKEKSWN